MILLQKITIGDLSSLPGKSYKPPSEYDICTTSLAETAKLLQRFFVAGSNSSHILNKGKSHILKWAKGTAHLLEADEPGELHADLNESNRPMEVMVIQFKNK